MRRSRRLVRPGGWAALAAAIAGLTCQTELASPPEGYPVAWAHNSCAPWDGPAVVLYLGQTLPSDPLSPTYPHLQVSIYSRPTELPGQRFHWEGSAPNEGSARRCVSEYQCLVADAVAVEFGNFQDPAAYAGSVDVTMPDGSSVAGGFSATKLTYQPLCG